MIDSGRTGTRLRPIAVAIGVLALVLCCAAQAVAAPRWQLSSRSAPTVLAPGSEAELAVAAINLGATPADGSGTPVKITDTLPAGLEVISVAEFPYSYVGYQAHFGELECTASPPSQVTCTWSGSKLPPYETLEVRMLVHVKAGASSGEVNRVNITGGGAPSALLQQPIVAGAGPVPFGPERYELKAENEDGSPDTQAGSHPFQLTSTLDFNQKLESRPQTPQLGDRQPGAPALVKDLHFELPPGLVGNPTPFAQCTDLEFGTLGPNDFNLCPPNTAVGVVSVTASEPAPGSKALFTLAVPLFNLTPAPGEPARFGFEALQVPVILDTSVRSGSDYGVNVSVSNTSEAVSLLSSRVTFWGVPGDSRHDQSRGWSCLDGESLEITALGECPTGPGASQPPALLTLPTSCLGQLKTTMQANSWAGDTAPQLEYGFQDATGIPLAMDGCNRLGFDPSIQATPDTQSASTPTGLTFGVHVPQDSLLMATGLAQAAVKDTTVTLPEGMQVNPASADGLEACSTGQVGFEGFGQPPEVHAALFSTAPAGCPDAAKVGTVQITTPLLAHPLTGGVYLAAQNANPFLSLLALYIVARDPVSGVLVKLAGRVTPDLASGRLTTTFENTPQLPFEDLQLHFFGGARAPLSTPPLCGTYTTTASFSPWSDGAPANPSASFAITGGANGSPCPNPLPFAPSLQAGSTNLQAGAFTPLTTTLSREDGNQNLAGVTLHLPPGLLGMLSSVTRCGGDQAALGTCPAASLIGHVVASVGLGPSPYTVSGGQVFITDSYKGAPFGLSIAEPAKAGPFDLGSGPCDCVVVRAKIDVDPHTSALTVTSDPLPTILQGIPLQLKHVNVTVDRPGFSFNPTNCGPLAITASLAGELGASAQASSAFRAANCATLPFKPRFTALTQGKTSKASGASLHVKVASARGQANIAKVRVDLPKQLPSRLTTLQKACVDRVFNANPAACPAASLVGTATAITPVLRSALTGPAYLVSHGGVAFPDLVIVLQGEGITLDLVGNTNIKKGITSSTFNAVPDAPVSTFDLVLPEGPHSVLATNLPAKAKASMCGQSLAMPTMITGQNGAVLKQTTKIAVSPCAKKKAKKAKRRKKGKRAGRARQRKGRGTGHGSHR